LISLVDILEEKFETLMKNDKMNKTGPFRIIDKMSSDGF